MLRRQQKGKFYAYPEHRSWPRRALWHLGFDPLTVRERLRQIDRERAYWHSLAEGDSHRPRRPLTADKEREGMP